MIIGPHTSHDPNHILVEKSMQLFPGQAPEAQWGIGFSSLMPCLFWGPDMLMPGNGESLGTQYRWLRSKSCFSG